MNKKVLIEGLILLKEILDAIAKYKKHGKI